MSKQRNIAYSGCRRAFAVLPLLVVMSGTAHAQQVPGSASPENIEKQLRSTPVEPGLPHAPLISEPVIPGHPAARAGKNFVLQHVKVEGASVYPASMFEDWFQADLGKKVTLEQLHETTDRITLRYHNDGYILSQAIIPKQDLTAGTLHIKVIEGFIDKITIEDDNPARDKRGLIDAYAEKIKKNRPLNLHTLERYMLLITDLPGISAQSVIQPSTSTFGAADLVITVHHKAVNAAATSDNRGNKYLGPYQEQMSLGANSLLGFDERTSLHFVNTLPVQEMHYFDIQHEEQIGSEGARLTFMGSVAKTHPGDTLALLDLKGTATDFLTTLTYPFLRSRTENVTSRVAFDMHNTENNALGVNLNNDRIRAIRLGTNYNFSDTFAGSNLADIAISHGVPWFDATNDGVGRSRSNAVQTFTKANLELSRLQNLSHGFSLLAAATGQYTSQPLLVSEQMSLGGEGFGSAYDGSEIEGDAGLAGKIELRYEQHIGASWLDYYQIYGYYDLGKVYINQSPDGSDSSLSLASTGLGVRSGLTTNLYGYTEIAFPLTRAISSEGNRQPRVFFSVSALF